MNPALWMIGASITGGSTGVGPAPKDPDGLGLGGGVMG